jgi:hypothetical protein
MLGKVNNNVFISRANYSLFIGIYFNKNKFKLSMNLSAVHRTPENKGEIHHHIVSTDKKYNPDTDTQNNKILVLINSRHM